MKANRIMNADLILKKQFAEDEFYATGLVKRLNRRWLYDHLKRKITKPIVKPASMFLAMKINMVLRS